MVINLGVLCVQYVHVGKREWPELVGVNVEDAKAVILRESTAVKQILVMKYPDIDPSDYCCNRVSIWVDELPNGTVLFAPLIG